MTNLNRIFESITPENIQSIELINEAMVIFIKVLESNSKISINMKNLFNSENEDIKKSLFYIYLNSLYNVIELAQKNQIVLDKLGDSDSPLKSSILDILNSDQFYFIKEIKQKTGTKPIIENYYNFAQYLQDGRRPIDDFTLTEINPFHFRTTGSIYKEIYEYVVKPLSHPVGFTHDYIQVITKSLNDYFGIKFIKIFKSVEVRCLDGYFTVFTDDENDINVKSDFLSRINFLTGELYTEEDYNKYVFVYYNKEVADYVDSDDSRVVTFTDGTMIKQTKNDIILYYINIEDELANNKKYIKLFSDLCSLFVDLDVEEKVLYSDSLMINETLVSENIDGFYIYTNDGFYITTSDNKYVWMT